MSMFFEYLPHAMIEPIIDCDLLVHSKSLIRSRHDFEQTYAFLRSPRVHAISDVVVTYFIGVSSILRLAAKYGDDPVLEDVDALLGSMHELNVGPRHLRFPANAARGRCGCRLPVGYHCLRRAMHAETTVHATYGESLPGLRLPSPDLYATLRLSS